MTSEFVVEVKVRFGDVDAVGRFQIVEVHRSLCLVYQALRLALAASATFPGVMPKCS